MEFSGLTVYVTQSSYGLLTLSGDIPTDPSDILTDPGHTLDS